MNERVFRSNARHLPPLPLPFFFELVRCFCELDLRGFLPLALPPPSLEYGDSPPELSPALDSAALDPEALSACRGVAASASPAAAAGALGGFPGAGFAAGRAAAAASSTLGVTPGP